ncbi:hypothetical protein DYB28_006509, partial [Aphanomyces astaci]
DGVHVVAITDQVVYYCMTDGAASTGNYVMHMMGASIPSQLVPRYGVPCAIYVPNHVAVQEPVLLLTTNAEEESDGFFTVDPVRKLQRQMARGKPATGLNCWVCGSHSSLHWGLKSDLQENVLTLEAELAKAQTRVTQVKNEADRRLRAELQLRRSWKKQQLEFEAQLATDDHQKILEQTTKSLLQQLQRNSQLLKHDGAETNVETAKSECVICRDRPANTAVYPCGHLCFCQEDGEKYQNHLRHQKQCPVCQVEMISLLRVYAP